MKNLIGAILVNGYANYDSVTNQITRLNEEFNKRNVKIDVILSSDSIAYVDNDGVIKCTLKPYNFIVFLDKDKHISMLLEKAGYKLFNSSKAIELCDDKMLTYIILGNKGLKLAKTYSSPLCYTPDADFMKYSSVVLENLSFPFLIKENFGSLGKQVYLISNIEEFERKEKELQGKPHLYQQFISESSGVDYRVIVIGNKVVGGMKRSNPNSFIANIGSGGVGTPYDVPDDMKKAAVSASKALGCDYCGVDFVINNQNEAVLIEVNSNAFFKSFESVTGINVATIYCDYILKHLK